MAPLPLEIFAAASMSFRVEKSAVIMRNEARKVGVSLCKLKHSGFWNFLANDSSSCPSEMGGRLRDGKWE